MSISPLSAENIDTVGDIETIDNVKDVNLYNDDENEKLKDSNPVYYFNASANVDGDGSKNNPYKYLRDERLPYGVTAYFADGVYEINSPCTVYSNDGVSITSATQVTFIGQSMENTIIKYVGNASIAIKIPDLARLFVSNMTFNHATIENRGTLDGTNVAFINNHGVDIHANLGYNNSFGGAIYSPGSNYYAAFSMPSYLKLNNCLFINNTAVYGGSIYHKNGNTIIKNSKFYNSSSGLYGGVLATDGGNITIENCIFENYRADDDAGGAIYSKVTNLAIKNANFANGHADFGGAICNLNSNLIIENVNFTNNFAKFDGGTIYDMYGNVTIKNVNIIQSQARDGGALFIDNCTSVIIKDTSFDESTATRIGGTIFSNANKLNLTNVTFGRSSALIDNIIHSQDKYNYDIGYNSNYELMKYNSSYNGVLPSKYNLVEEGYSTPIRNQMAGGNCWAFGPLAALESCILKATGKSMDLSEENIKNLIEKYSAYGWDYDTNNGGHSEMMWGNLISWIGPVLESDDKYDDYSTLSTLLDAVMHVQNVYYLPTRTNALDNNAIKKAILDYGAVGVTIYMDDSNPLVFNKDKSAHFYTLSTKAYANHAVCIVGWDDNYDKNNFPMGNMAATNGAWIVKNSWGSDWGDNGYFYVSYYDPVVYGVGIDNSAFTFILNDTVRYNRNYQYDIGGMTDFLYTESKTVYYKNTFTSIGNDILTAFSTVFEFEKDYEVSLYINNDLKLTQRGHSLAGYFTIPFEKEFPLKIGDNFTISIKLNADKDASFPIYEIVSASRLSYDKGVSFFSLDGQTWKDLFDFVYDRPDLEHKYSSQVACIKAFTRCNSNLNESNIVVNDITANMDEIVTITATIFDKNNKLINEGVVTFLVDDKKEFVNVVNGRAIFQTSFKKAGIFDLTVKFDGGNNYFSSENTTKVVINKASKINTRLEISEVTTNDENSKIKITLSDINDNPIDNEKVILSINNNLYEATTNFNGVAYIEAKLSDGIYIAKCDFKGSDKYNSITTQTQVKILKEKINSIKSSNITRAHYSGIDFQAIFLNKNGNPLVYTVVTFIVDGKEYNEITDANGVAKLNANLNVGKHKITSINPVTEDITFNTVNIVKRITLNKDLTMDYNGHDTFNVCVYGDNGKIANDGEIVIFKINEKTYKIKTDKKGYAKLKINLIPNTYKIITEYKGEKVVNNVIVKHVLKAKNIKVKKAKIIKFKATLKSSNGKAIKNKKITFKINGKTYSSKTNKKGIASISLKNLKVGKYTIKSSYIKSSIKSTIQIKK